MNLIVNVARNWAIGKDNELLFHLKRDMKEFRAHTVGNVVVMGRKTLDSFPGGKPLPNRTNIVLTHNSDFKRDGAVICCGIDELYKTLNEFDSQKIYVIGGDSVYRLLLPMCDTAYVTKTDAIKDDADTYMPNLDEDPEWEISDESENFEENGLSFKFITYKRIKK